MRACNRKPTNKKPSGSAPRNHRKSNRPVVPSAEATGQEICPASMVTGRISVAATRFSGMAMRQKSPHYLILWMVDTRERMVFAVNFE
jgi:hypothetical protein